MNVNGFSYMCGVITGIIIRWSDVIPIVGGICLGMTIRNINDIIDMHDINEIIKNYFLIITKKITNVKNNVNNDVKN